MEKEVFLDINGRTRIWEGFKKTEFKSKSIEGLSKHNSEIAIAQLKDFELGINCTTSGRRTPATLLKLRGFYRTLSKRIKNKNIEQLTKEELTKIVIKENSQEFAKGVKVIFTWLYKSKRIKENIVEHILANDYSKGKPAWVYLGEERIKLLLSSLGPNHKALAYLLFDSGIRPEEAWRLRVYDLQEDCTLLDIVDKRSNGERVAKKTSFGRKVKLKLCSELLNEYIKINKLKPEDTLFQITQAGFNKALRVATIKLFGKEQTKSREYTDKITNYDIRHNSACFWLKRYKTHKDLMYRFGWKSEDKILYYTEFLDVRDTIDDEDLLTKEDKTRLENEIIEMNKKFDNKEKIYIEMFNNMKMELEKLKRKN